MENSVKELSKYRFERAKEMLDASKENLEIGQYRTSLNRSYYAVFHAMRAVNVLKGYANFQEAQKQLQNANTFIDSVAAFLEKNQLSF